MAHSTHTVITFITKLFGDTWRLRDKYLFACTKLQLRTNVRKETRTKPPRMWGASLARTQQTRHENAASMRWILPRKTVHDLWIMQELRYIFISDSTHLFSGRRLCSPCLITSLSRILWGLRWSLIGTQFKLNFWERSGSVSATELSSCLNCVDSSFQTNDKFHSPVSALLFSSDFVWLAHYSSPWANSTVTIPVAWGSIRD